MVQGIGGAMMVPVGRLVLLRTVSKAELVRAMAWLMIPATAGPILGPPVGGFIVTYLSWRWIFYINVPARLTGIVSAMLVIEPVRAREPGPLDWGGLCLSGTSLASLMFGLEMAGRGTGSRPVTAALLGVGAGAALLYAWHARRTPQPILDFRLMRIPT